MLSPTTIEMAVISAAKQQGKELNGKDLLDIRTGIAASLAAKERHRKRMNAPEYQWKRPTPRR
ncbi:TPA: hypothetical protein LSW83_004086 [Serratia marcescens]|nr:hypothetical protein [Serratia marcescens]